MLGIASRINRASSSSSGLGAPKLVPFRSASCERCDDARMRVAEDQRAPREDVVDVAVAVDVDEVRALAALDEERRAADRAERAHRRADAAREEIERLGEEALRDVAAHARAPGQRADHGLRGQPRPERMQSGIPTPRYAAPATASPGCSASAASIRASRSGWPSTYCGMPARPPVDASEGRIRRDAEERELVARRGDQLLVRVERDIAASEPPQVDAQEDRAVRRPSRPTSATSRCRRARPCPRCAGRRSRSRRAGRRRPARTRA